MAVAYMKSSKRQCWETSSRCPGPVPQASCTCTLHSDTVSEVHEGVAPEVVGAEEASEEYYGAYDESYEMADALLSLRDSAAAKNSKSEEVYVEQRSWHQYQGEDDPIYEPRQHEVSILNCSSKIILLDSLL